MSNDSTSDDSFSTLSSLAVDGKTYHYYSLPKAGETLGDLNRMPFSLKVLTENLLRFEDGVSVETKHLEAMAQ